MPPVDFFADLQVLDTLGVRYVVVGGVAMSLHGADNMTFNLDVCYAAAEDNPNTEAFVKMLSARNVRMVAQPEGVDDFEGLWERAVVMEIAGVLVRVASIADLIAMKQAADRPKDRGHIMQLQALLAVQSKKQ